MRLKNAPMLRAVTIALCATVTASTPDQASPTGCLPISREALRVIDGDTVAIEGLQLVAGGRSLDLGEMVLRLEGIDAPELGWRAACDREARLAGLARDRLQDLVGRAEQLLACPTRRKTLGRYRGALRDGRADLGLLLVVEGLAASGDGRSWCPPRRPQRAITWSHALSLKQRGR